MKIAILTMVFNNNYGGLLQSYALMTSLKKLGYEPELLYVHDFNSSDSLFLSSLKRIVKNFIKKKKEKNIRYFIDKYIEPKTKPIYNKNKFLEIVNDYGAYIVGSDQVWRPDMYKYIDFAFFDFVKKENAILLSYAPSFGVDEWLYSDSDTIKYKEQIKKFRAVSVREESAVNLCKKYFDIDAEHVLDPTLLLNPSDYIKIINEENEVIPKIELFTYILDVNNDKIKSVNFVSQQLKFDISSIKLESDKDKSYPSITEWLKNFAYSKFIVTDSFHGCVFSILFNKPFIVYGNSKRGMTRFHSILKLFNLEERLIYSFDDISANLLNNEIDWVKVNSLLAQNKEKSIDFLLNNLNSKDSL
ncbi:polysaccharide pyruvyl transferase family protein [Arcobacter sp. YIC-464]|uniref:polysaccharide pyruvyl transferase family protein n=1 Tax=Arcobacter sp. YIC-464 TaxID=3376631 RepID=UPI003C260BC9